MAIHNLPSSLKRIPAKPAPSLNARDIRILKLIAFLLSEHVIEYEIEFCRAIGISKQKLSSIKTGKQSFTAEQIEAICKKYQVNGNYVFGLEKEMFRK